MIATNCLSTIETDCEPNGCRWRCPIEVIDELLSQPSLITGNEADDLLDLRWKLLQADDAEGMLRLFCRVRLRMEQRHYLAFFRIRRWIENHMVAVVILRPGAEEKQVSVKLDHYCVEALRRASLCVAIQTDSVIDRPRLRFRFRPKRSGQDVCRGAEISGKQLV